MRVLVTGSTGYLGQSVVAQLLGRGHELVLLGRAQESPFGPDVEYHALDLLEEGALTALVEDASVFDAIVHLAGPAPKLDQGFCEESIDLVATHLRLVLALRHAFADWRGRIVHASGMPVYGLPRQLPVDESASRVPIHMYGLAKLLSEDAILSWRSVDRWVLRLPGLFSAERRSGALYHFMKAAAAGAPIRLTAQQPTPWDVLHVEDAALAISQALASEHVNPGAVNVSYGEPVDLESLARWISRLGGRDSPIEDVAGVRHPPFQMHIGRAKQLLGWPPATLHQRLTSLFQAYEFDGA